MQFLREQETELRCITDHDFNAVMTPFALSLEKALDSLQLCTKTTQPQRHLDSVKKESKVAQQGTSLRPGVRGALCEGTHKTADMRCSQYGLAAIISRLLQNIGLFCRLASIL